MFRNLLGRLFSDPDPGHGRHDRLSADDADLALAALLVRIARADNHYDAEEQRRIEAILVRRQALGPAEAIARRSAAEMIEAEAPDTVRFTRTLKKRIPLEDRRDIIAAMWEVALADGIRDPEEDSTIRLVSGLLGINDRDTALERLRVSRPGRA